MPRQCVVVAAENSRRAQEEWARRPIGSRLSVLGRARASLAARSKDLIQAMPASLARTRADSLVAEVLPLLAACKFLEREAAQILKTRTLGRRGLPWWLAGVDTAIERVPFGIVLVIAPANYPLFLPGVQALQALAAGNAVVWKPGRGGREVASLFELEMLRAGLPAGLLRITDDSVAAGEAELAAKPDKIVFTGSAASGRDVLRQAAETATPVIAELSGCDAVVALPMADPQRVADALTFGMRLNGSATCMAPRRLFLVGGGDESLVEMLKVRFAATKGVALSDPIRREVRGLLEEARGQGATIVGDDGAPLLQPILVLDGTPEMRIARADLFAPVLTVISVGSVDAMVEADSVCPMGLTAAIFGEPAEARRLGERLKVGTVLINDLIVPTADPRVSFGGRRGSGFGVTRGAEGLLEMTAAKTIALRRGKNVRHFETTGEAHEDFFEAAIVATHGANLRVRLRAVWRLVRTARHVK